MQLDNILAMVPDEDVRDTIADRFKVCVYPVTSVYGSLLPDARA